MEYSPELLYKGNQVIIASGRIVFNAKDDAVLIFAKKSIGLSCYNEINLIGNDIVLDTSRLYLGSK